MKAPFQYSALLKFFGILILILNTNLAANAQSSCVDSSLITNNPCPSNWDPVCGCNGVTYGNACEAESWGGVTSWISGICSTSGLCVDSSMIDMSVACPLAVIPVCGCDGVTYLNVCEAFNYGGVTAWTPGICPPSSDCIDSSLINFIICSTDYNPVCGCDNVTYTNACQAENYYGVSSWTVGPCSTSGNCIDSSLIDYTVLCTADYTPVCGCDGVTYSNICFATNYGGVTSWTAGVCGGVQMADPCTDLAGIDFGDCDMYLGYGLVNGNCSSISGCGTIVDGVDYSQAILLNDVECQTNCGGTQYSEPCDDLANIDFGFCTMYMGIGIINGQCVGISGCGWEVNGIDYTPSFYPNMDSCQACLTNQIDKIPSFDLNIFPNPTNGKINVQVSESTRGTISVMDLSGRILITKLIAGKLTELNLSYLSAGTYFVKVDDGKSVVVRKVTRR